MNRFLCFGRAVVSCFLIFFPFTFIQAQEHQVIMQSGDLPLGIIDGEIIDLDGDGDEEFVFYSWADHTIYSTEINTGPTTNYDTLIVDLHAADAIEFIDFDEDGDLDIVTHGGNAFEDWTGIRVYEQFNGAFIPHTVMNGVNGSGLAFADIDNDLDMDIILGVPDYGGPSLIIAVNEGEWEFSVLEVEEQGYRGGSPQIMDYNNDNLPDIQLSLRNTDQVVVYVNMGNNLFEPTVLLDNINEVEASILTDLDLDGDLDLVVHKWGNNSIRIFQNQGDWSFQEQTEILLEREPVAFVLSDIDGDGDEDFLFCEDRRIRNHLVTNNGNFTFTDAVIDETCFDTNLIIPIDFSGDNSLDLLFLAANDNKMAYLEKNSNGYELVKTVGVTLNPLQTHVLDWDEDGDYDIICLLGQGDPDPLFANSIARVVVFERKEGNRFVSRTISAGFFDPKMMVVEDFDGDGREDIVHISEQYFGSPPDFYIIHNLEGWDMEILPVNGTINQYKAITVGDLNNDGLKDVVCYVAPAGTPTGIATSINNGDGTFSNTVFPVGGAFTTLTQVKIYDANNDGYNDIVALRGFDNVLNIYFQNEDGSFTQDVVNVPGAGANGRYNHFEIIDFDGDNDMDLIVTAEGDEEVNGEVAVLENQGDFESFSYSALPLSENAINPSGLECGFIDDDGNFDIIVTCFGSDNVFHYELIDGQWVETLMLQGVPEVIWSSTVYDENGWFMALVSAGNSQISVTGNDVLNTPEVELMPRANIYPNPAFTNISVAGLKNLKVIDYEVYDATGKLHLSGQSDDLFNLNIEMLKPGLYILILKGESQYLYRQSFIKR